MLIVNNLYKYFDGIKALDDFSTRIKPNHITGLIGPNGAGKTTLFNVITGFIAAEKGEILLKNKSIIDYPSYKITRSGIARTFQKLRLINQMTVLDNLMLSYPVQPGEQICNVFFKNKEVKSVEAQNKKRSLALLEYAGIIEKKDDLAGNLSFGQQKLLSIICCLATDAELLLLDEPIAGINPEMAKKILSILEELPNKNKTVIIIEHDMNFIKDICDTVIFMDAGRKICEGTPDQVLNDDRVIEAYLD